MVPPKVTPEQQIKIAELRSKISERVVVKDEYFKSDGYLFSWLEDKKFKVDKAADGILKTLTWRENNQVNSLLSGSFDHHKSWMPTEIRINGQDNDGRPIVIAYNRNDELTESEIEDALTKLANDKELAFRYACYHAELIHDAIRKAAQRDPSRMIKDVVAIADMKAVKMSDYTKYTKLILPIARELLTIAEDYYPGMLHQAFIINSPKKKSIRLLIAMLKPFVKGDLLDRVKVYGRKPEKWQPALLGVIPSDQLLAKFGGTNGLKD